MPASPGFALWALSLTCLVLCAAGRPGPAGRPSPSPAASPPPQPLPLPPAMPPPPAASEQPRFKPGHATIYGGHPNGQGTSETGSSQPACGMGSQTPWAQVGARSVPPAQHTCPLVLPPFPVCSLTSSLCSSLERCIRNAWSSCPAGARRRHQPCAAPSRLRAVPAGGLRRQGHLPRRPGCRAAPNCGGRLRQLRRGSDSRGTWRLQVRRAVCQVLLGTAPCVACMATLAMLSSGFPSSAA